MRQPTLYFWQVLNIQKNYSVSKEEKNKVLNPNLIKRILSYTRPYKKLFFGSAFITIFLSALAIVRPLLISKALNDFVVKDRDMPGLNAICLLILAFLLIEAACQVVNIRITNLLGQNIV